MCPIIFSYNIAPVATPPAAKNYYIDVYGLVNLSNEIAFRIFMTSGDGTSLAVDATPTVSTYITTNCTGTATSYNYTATTLPANANTGDFTETAGQGTDTGVQTVKVTSLSVTINGNSTTITTSPQTVVAGGNNYIITGRGVCTAI